MGDNRIGMNDMVKVKLTDVGISKWRAIYGVTRTELELPMWELMSAFGGSSMHMGMRNMYFVDNEIELVS